MGEHDDTRDVSKPFEGPQGQTFESFDACVSTFEDEDGIDDAEAFCGWLQEEGKDALNDPNAEEVLTGLDVEFVSAVDEPAQDSEWVIAKDAEDPDGDTHRWKTEVPLYVAKSDGDTAVADENEDFDDRVKQVAFAPVLIPDEADKQGDVIPTPAIEDAAHRYLAEYRKVDSDHDLRDGKGTPVESWTLKQDTVFEMPDGTQSREYPAGTWVMGIQFDDDTWKRVADGDLTGLSIYGGAKPVDVDALLGKGDTPAGTSAGVTRRDVLQSASDADAVPAAKQEDDPCTDGYVMVGTKIDENGNEVPNCVPEDQADAPDLSGSVDDTQDKDMPDDGDPDESGNDDGSNVSKMLSADQISQMLASVGESDGLKAGSTVEDFVLHAVEQGEVDESQITNMSVLLQDGGATEPEADGEHADDEMMGDDDTDGDDDGGVTLEADADDTDDGAERAAAKSVNVDVDADDDDGAIAKVADAVDTLAKKVENIQDKVEDRSRRGDKMDTDDLSDRIAKDLTGTDDADVARKAIREQVEKSDTDAVPDVDYGGITDDEDVDAEATDTDDGGSLHSSAANKRMVGGND